MRSVVQRRFIMRQGAIMHDDTIMHGAMGAAARPERPEEEDPFPFRVSAARPERPEEEDPFPFRVSVADTLDALGITEVCGPECAAWQAAVRATLEPHGSVVFRVKRGDVDLCMDIGVMRCLFAPLFDAAAACAPAARIP